ncbi:hypothetical protein E0198_001891 [Clavispora lusitaniae]|nr:hypothetical protein E0198_001891 [Clavispora lusitaniae]
MSITVSKKPLTQIDCHTTAHRVISGMSISIIHSPDMPSASKVSERPFTWAEVRDIVKYNELEALARSHSTTEKYLSFKKQLREAHTTVFKHLVVETLKWRTKEQVQSLDDSEIVVPRSGSPLFCNAEDLKIVLNDFPYHFEDDIVHLCVWTKKRIESDPNNSFGDISPQMRAHIEKYVVKTFVDGLGIPREDLVWFRNWDALQSVKEISHIHVVIKGMTSEQLQQVLGGPGVPLDESEVDLPLN